MIFFLVGGNWGGNSSGQSSNATNNTQQWNNTAQRPPTSQADSKFQTEQLRHHLVIIRKLVVTFYKLVRICHIKTMTFIDICVLCG